MLYGAVYCVGNGDGIRLGLAHQGQTNNLAAIQQGMALRFFWAIGCLRYVT